MGQVIRRVLKPMGMPQGMDPKEWRQAVEARLNELLDRSMALITALDLMEVDPDLEEPGDLEHSRGPGASGGGTDLEMDDCDDEAGGDEEPYLAGAASDLEDDQIWQGETVAWSNDTTIPQEGERWHGHTNC